MKHPLRFLLCFHLLLVLAASATAQEHQPIRMTLKEASFQVFVDSIEAQTPYRFYFDETLLDSFPVTITSSTHTLPALLQKLFTHTPFHFAIDANQHVFITQRAPLHLALPQGFFDKTKPVGDSSDLSTPLLPSETIDASSNTANTSKLIEVGSKSNSPQKSNATIVGYIRDAKSGEPIAGASVYVDTPAITAITNQYGYYTITLPRGRHTLKTSSVGMDDEQYQILVHADGKLNLEMQDFIPSLKAVVVLSERTTNIRSLQMGVNRLNIKAIKQVPVVFGETDVLRVVLTLPGVTSAGEAATGFNVRGGSADQNLILFNDATIYNPSHLFGFFSAFNADVVKDVELFKSGIPPKYGGRLSSVLNITTKEGNTKKWSGVGGLGLLTSRLTIEGPLSKEKTTVIVSGRTTYSNWLVKKISNELYRNSEGSFYDLSLHLNHTLSKKSNIYITGYLSHDAFKLNTDTLYQYGNKNFNIKWKYNYNNKLTSVFTAGYDHYDYTVSSEQNPVNAFRLSFNIEQQHFRADFNYAASNKHQFSFGFNSIYYKIHPGKYEPLGSQSLVQQEDLSREQGLESALYIGDVYTVSPKLSINAGLRYSLFNYLGPREVYNYVKGMPRQEHTIVDTLQYGSGKIITTHHGPEYRLSMRYSLPGNSSLKLSFNTLRQYIHMLSNTTAVSPTDIWKLSDPNIKPQQGYQLSLGYYRNFKSNTIETSLEVYYKRLKNYLDYKSGATLLMNQHIETDVINTKGKAYGAELFIKKESGKLNGWFSYTYARTWLQTDDPIAGESINNGLYYPASFDKPHIINLISNYRFSHRFSISLNTVYSTGRPITIPLAVFNQGGAQRPFYSQRNDHRIPDYFRTDLSLTLEGNHKIKKLTHSSWSLGVYNLTGRENAYSVYFQQENGVIKGYQLSIFGVPIPFITYNFRF